MADVRTISAEKYNKILAEALKKIEEFQVPEWVTFVKSSVHKARPIAEPDFWYKRAASILRQLYIRNIVGVGRLRTRYGGRKARGSRPAEFRKASGKIIRTILKQAEAASLVEKSKEKKAGRKLTENGRKFLEELAK